MPEKMTHKEHDARAMLLGRVYDWRDGTYCKTSDGSSTNVTAIGMIDAMTLAPITQSVASTRAGQWLMALNGRTDGWSQKLTFFCRPETPYAKAEE